MDEFEKIDIDKYIDWYKATSNEALSCRDLYTKWEKLDKVITYLEIRANIPVAAFIEGLSGKKNLSLLLWSHFRKELENINDRLSLIEDENKICGLGYDEFLTPTSTQWEYFQITREKRITKNIINFKSLLKRSIATEKDIAIEKFENLHKGIQESPFYAFAIEGFMLLNEKKACDISFSEFILWIEKIDFANWLQEIIVPEIRIKNNFQSLENQNKTIAQYYYYLGKAGERDLYDEEIFNQVMKERHSPKTLKRAMQAVCEINERIGIEANPNANKQRTERLKTVIKMLEKKGNVKSIKLAKADLKALLSKQN